MTSLPIAGVMRSGAISRLPSWEKRLPHLYTDTLLPTPTEKDGPSGPGTSSKREGGLNLRTAVSLIGPACGREAATRTPFWHDHLCIT